MKVQFWLRRPHGVITALTGIERGMDYKVPWSPSSEQNAISIALSESIYGLHLGYVGYASVHDKLTEFWNRGAKDPNDPILIENNSNDDERCAASGSVSGTTKDWLSFRSHAYNDVL